VPFSQSAWASNHTNYDMVVAYGAGIYMYRLRLRCFCSQRKVWFDLPRQAGDKREDNWKKQLVFPQAVMKVGKGATTIPLPRVPSRRS
jgi:hypothetical protein